MKCRIGLYGWAVIAMAAAAAPPPHELLPAETWVVVSIPDMAQARRQCEQMPYAKLWKDPAMKSFKDKFSSKWAAEVVTPLEREFGVDFAQLSGLAQGQVTLALTRTGMDAEQSNPGCLILVDSKDREEDLTKLLTDLKKKWADSDKVVKTVSLRGIEFSSLSFNPKEIGRSLQKALPFLGSKQDADQEGKNVEWLIGQSAGLLVVGDHVADVEKLLARTQGGSAPNLAEQEKFAADFPQLLRDSTGYLWMDLGAILRQVLDRMGKEPGEDGGGAASLTPQKLFEPLGLMGLQTLSVAFRDESGGGLVDALVKVPASQRKGIFDLLRFEALDADPPSFVPADVTSFFRFRWNLGETWQRLERLVKELSPQAAAVLSLVLENAGKDKDSSFDLRQNLIANLGNDIISYEKAVTQIGPDGSDTAPAIYLLGSPRPEQLSSAIKALSSLMPVPGGVKEREFLGRTVYSLNLSQNEGAAQRIHFSPSGGYVAVSLDEAMLEGFLRTSGNPGDSLRDSRPLRQAAEKVGGMSTGLFGYENQQANMRVLVETLRKDSGSLDNLFSKTPLSASLSGGQIKEWADFSLLPPFEKVAKYFNITVHSGAVTAEGFRFKLYSPYGSGQ